MTDDYKALQKSIEKSIKDLKTTLSTQFIVTPQTIDNVYRRWVGAKGVKPAVELTLIDDALDEIVRPLQQAYTRPNEFNILRPMSEYDLDDMLYVVPLITTYLYPLGMFAAGLVGGYRKEIESGGAVYSKIHDEYLKRKAKIEEESIPRAIDDIQTYKGIYDAFEELGIDTGTNFSDFLKKNTTPDYVPA